MDFSVFLRMWVKTLVKNISKNLSGKYSQKLLDYDKKSATDSFQKEQFKYQQSQLMI